MRLSFNDLTSDPNILFWTQFRTAAFLWQNEDTLTTCGVPPGKRKDVMLRLGQCLEKLQGTLKVLGDAENSYNHAQDSLVREAKGGIGHEVGGVISNTRLFLGNVKERAMEVGWVFT